MIAENNSLNSIVFFLNIFKTQINRLKKIFQSIFYNTFEGRWDLFPENIFKSMIAVELQRMARSHIPFGLIVIDVHQLFLTHRYKHKLTVISKILNSCTRDTDTKGWLKTNHTIGIKCLDTTEKSLNDLREKVTDYLKQNCSPKIFSKINLTLLPIPSQP